MSDHVFIEQFDPTKFSSRCKVCEKGFSVDLPLSITNLTAIIDAFCAGHEHKELDSAGDRRTEVSSYEKS